MADGSTTVISFDPYGDRKTPIYELLNVREAVGGTKHIKQVGLIGGSSGDGSTGVDEITVGLFNSNQLLSMRVLPSMRNTYKGAYGISSD